MGNRNNEFDVTHTFTAHFLLGNFHTTTVAHDTFVSDAFVFSAVTFVVFYRTEDTLTEESVAFRLISTIVDGFRFENLTT